jgi:hypothetical protein
MIKNNDLKLNIVIKKIPLSLLLWFSTTMLLSQIKSDTILYENKNIDDIPIYIINDGIHYKWQWNKRNMAYTLFKDSLQLPLKVQNLALAHTFLINILKYCTVAIDMVIMVLISKKIQ